MNAFNDYDDLHGTPQKMAEARSYTPSWYERLAGAASNAFDGGSRGSYETAMKFVGPENPFNAPAQITRGGANIAEGYRRGDGLQAIGGAMESGLAALPLASKSIGSAMRRPMLKHAPEEFEHYIRNAKGEEIAKVDGSVRGNRAFIDGAWPTYSSPDKPGHVGMASALRDLQQKYPYVTDIYANRISGTRHGGKQADYIDELEGAKPFIQRRYEAGDPIARVGVPVLAGLSEAFPQYSRGLYERLPSFGDVNMHMKVKPGWQR